MKNFKTIVVFAGSVRKENYTLKTAKIIADEIESNDKYKCNIITLNDYDLPLPGRSAAGNDIERFREKVAEAVAVVMVTPEYNGSVSSVLKIMIENLSYPSEVNKKPVALVGVASGDIGAIKSLEHLRSISAHIGGIVLPKQASIPTVEEYFDENDNCTDPKIEKRIRSVAKYLIDYLEKR